MTHDEFRQKYEAYSWDPYHPLAVILADGKRVHIDTPEQARLTADALVLTRRVSPHKSERYPYAGISRLVPLLELPADRGGMSYAEFDPAIRKLLMAEPFQPFSIELTTGEVVEIAHRSELGRAGRFLRVHKGAANTHLTYDQVAKLIPQSGAVSA